MRYVFSLAFLILAASTFAINIGVDNSVDCNIPATTYNFSAIQDAVNNATDGDTIYVCANGGYAENVVVNVSVNIYGNQSGVLVNSSGLMVFNITANFVNISNFSVGFNTYGFFLLNSSNNILSNNNVTAISAGSGEAFHLEGNSTGNIISNNNITSPGNGIDLSYGPNNNTISGNYIHNAGNGMLLNNASNNTIRNNNVTNAAIAYYLYNYSDNNTLIINIAHNASSSAFVIQTSSYNNITNNTLTTDVGVANLGFQLRDYANNNTFYRNNVTAHSTNLKIWYNDSNNTFRENYFADSMVWIQDYSCDNIFINNIFIDAISDFTPDDCEQVFKYENDLGLINYPALDDLTVSDEISIGTSIILDDNLVGVEINENLSNLNTSAEIEIRDVFYSDEPQLLKNGVRCDDNESLCNISYDADAGIIYANVSSFSNYSSNGTPVVSTSDNEQQHKSLELAETVFCPDDIVEVWAISGGLGVEAAIIRLILTDPYDGLVASNLTDQNGNINFSLLTSGTYEIYGRKEGYGRPEPLVFKFDYRNCSASTVAMNKTVEPTVQPPPPPEQKPENTTTPPPEQNPQPEPTPSQTNVTVTQTNKTAPSKNDESPKVETFDFTPLIVVLVLLLLAFIFVITRKAKKKYG